MKALKFYTFCFLLLSLSGCVFLDIASQDTAIPIYPKKISTALYLSNGINIDETFGESGEEEGDPEETFTPIMINYKLGFGVTRKVDLLVNMSESEMFGVLYYGKRYKGRQFEAGIKYLFYQKDKSYGSILPSLYRLKASHLDADTRNEPDEEYEITGFEVQGLYTYRANDYVSGSLIGKGSLNKITKSALGEDPSTLHRFHYGGRANLRLSFSFLHLTSEAGFEVVPKESGNTYILGNYSAGLGLQF